MGKSRSNTFKRAIRHLKSTQIDEKIHVLSEIPTNNTYGIYVVEPEGTEITGENIDAPLDLTQDDPTLNGRDTTGLFGEDGSILTIEPPGDTSYILGPMMSMWYSWGNFSTIGYIRQSDRRMVDLGRISGTIANWNGTSNFTSYGQLTLAQAQWYRDQYGEGNTQPYRAFYPGPPSNPADEFGRYLGDLIDKAKELAREVISRIPPVLGPWDPNILPGSANPNNKKKKKEDDLPDGAMPPDKVPGENLPTRGASKPKTDKGLEIDTKWHGTSKDAADKIKNDGFKTTKTGLVPDKVWVGDKNVAGDYSKGGRSSGSMGKNAPDDRTLIPVRTPRGSGTTLPDWGGTQTALPKDVADRGAGNKNVEKRKGRRPNRGTTVRTPGMSGSLGATGSPSGRGPYTPGGGGRFGVGGVGLADEYHHSNNTISESTRSILKNLKKPYVLPEEPKIKIKHRPKVNGSNSRTINSDLMKKAEVPTSFKPDEDRLWGKYEKNKNARMSQERKNEVLDHLGGSDHYWEFMTETSRQKSNDIMYGNFGGKEKKAKLIRKEELKGDTLLFIADENGKKESILQSELSIRIANEFNKKLFEKYFEEQETVQADKDPLFKKVAKRLKKEIDYSDKPAKKGYPNDPPPKMVNGWHPEYGTDKGYYNKLDPHSAEAMAKTSNDEIDAKVEKAKSKQIKIKERKKHNWRIDISEDKKNYLRGKNIQEGMTSSGVFQTILPATGDVDLSSIDITNQASFSDFENVDIGSDSFFSQYGGIENALTFSSYKFSPYAFINTIDTTAIDTVSFTGVAGDFSNGSLPTNSDLFIFWYDYDTGAYGDFVAIPKTATTLSTYNITLPPEARGKNVEIGFFQYRPNANAGQDLIGYGFPVGDEFVEITDNNDGLIASLLVNYDETDTDDTINWGRLIASSISRNTTNIDGVLYPDSFYPGYVGPVSGNVGDPDIDGFNADLNNLKTRSGSFVLGYLTYDTTLQDIEDRFVGTDLDASQFFSDLQSARYYGNLFDTYNSLYNQYYSSNPTLADYYLGLANEASSNQDIYLNQLEAQLDAANAFPDSRWTDEDYAKVATDIYNQYKGASSYAITNFSTKRRTPQNVFVPLDSPEASSFIRTDPIMANLSPQERLKKLKDMLEASDEYVMKMLGLDFPGTGSVPPGEYDPFKQAPPGEAGDTPGVEISQLYPADYDMERNTDTMLLKGLQRGDYGTGPAIDKQIQNIMKNMQRGTPGGLPKAQASQDTQIASEPLRGQRTDVRYDPNMKMFVPRPSNTDSGTNVQDLIKQASLKKTAMVASYEPEGQVLSEKKLKSPEEVLNKIPGYYDGKPAPLGFPVEPPPKMVNGIHPDLVDGKKIADRFNRLDPESAKAMPPTGNPHIDKKVRAARKKPK